MRIAFVCDTLGAGGAERVISTLSNEFVRKGNYVNIIMLSHKADSPFYYIDDSVNLFYVNKNDKKIRYIKKAIALRDQLISINPDIVISFLSYVCIYTWLALWKTNIPFIVSERNDPNQRSIIKQWLVKKSFKASNGCVFQTHEAMKWYGKNISYKSVVINNPVSLKFIPNNTIMRKKQLLYVGRFVEQKNCLLLLDAFKLFLEKHNDYVLKMYGEGPLENDIRNKITKLNIEDKIRLLHSDSNWQLNDYNSTIFILPSKYEGMPNSLAEALCLGIPSVATDCPIGGAKELKKLFPNLLFLANNNDYKDLHKKMEDALLFDNQICGIPTKLCADYISKKWIEFISSLLVNKNKTQ